MKRSDKRTHKYIILILCLITAMLVSFFLWGKRTPQSAPVVPKSEGEPVKVAIVSQADVPVTLQALGNVVSESTVNVTSRVDGQLIKVLFTEGDEVKKGQLLAQVDPREYQAILQRYRGELAENNALLKSASTQLKRFQALQQRNLIASQQLDDQDAAVEKLRGAVMATKAQIASAQLKLTFTNIIAPVSGRAGLRLVDEGNMILASENKAIVTITQEHPIAVNFSLPQESLPEIRARQQHARLPLTLFDANNRRALAHCTLRYIDNEIDRTTGSIKFKAVCDNQNGTLYPSQLVNIHLQIELRKAVTLVPERAIQYGQKGNFVYVVDAEQHVNQRLVTSGMQNGQGDIAVDSGLKTGERVVTEGFAALHDGSIVQIVDRSDEEKASRL